MAQHLMRIPAVADGVDTVLACTKELEQHCTTVKNGMRDKNIQVVKNGILELLNNIIRQKNSIKCIIEGLSGIFGTCNAYIAIEDVQKSIRKLLYMCVKTTIDADKFTAARCQTQLNNTYNLVLYAIRKSNMHPEYEEFFTDYLSKWLDGTVWHVECTGATIDECMQALNILVDSKVINIRDKHVFQLKFEQ